MLAPLPPILGELKRLNNLNLFDFFENSELTFSKIFLAKARSYYHRHPSCSPKIGG